MPQTAQLTRQQALDYFHSPDLIGLGFEADAVRRRLHPEGVVTYIIDRNINYTNFCTEYCTFCAFYRPLPKPGVTDPRSEEGYILDFETIYEKIAETVEMGGTGVLMQGGIHPDLKIDWFERLFSGIKQRFPQIWLHCLTASEILAIAKYSDCPCATPSFVCATRAWIPFPEAARRFWTTMYAAASRASNATPRIGSASIARRISWA